MREFGVIDPAGWLVRVGSAGRVTAPPRIYLDGNSLGPPAPGTADALARRRRSEWDDELIGGWNAGLVGPAGHGRRAARAAPRRGTGPGGRGRQHDRDVVQGGGRGAPPAPGPQDDRHPGAAASRPTATSSTRSGPRSWRSVPTSWPTRSTTDTAVLAVTHVDYRTGRRLDLAALTAAAHAPARSRCGTCRHSVGAMDLHLDDDERRPRGGLHLQVPQRRPGLAGLHLRRRARTWRARPAASPAGWATPTRSRCPRCTSRPPASADALRHAVGPRPGGARARPRPLRRRRPRRPAPHAAWRSPTAAIERADALGLEVVTPRDADAARQPGQPPPRARLGGDAGADRGRCRRRRPPARPPPLRLRPRSTSPTSDVDEALAPASPTGPARDRVPWRQRLASGRATAPDASTWQRYS